MISTKFLLILKGVARKWTDNVNSSKQNTKEEEYRFPKNPNIATLNRRVSKECQEYPPSTHNFVSGVIREPPKKSHSSTLSSRRVIERECQMNANIPTIIVHPNLTR